jgi:hypothetical protein
VYCGGILLKNTGGVSSFGPPEMLPGILAHRPNNQTDRTATDIKIPFLNIFLLKAQKYENYPE